MANSEFKEAPPLYGWAIAVAAGALMFGVSLVVLDLGGIAAVAVGAVVALILGVIFTLAESKPASAPAAKEAGMAASASAPAPAAASAPKSAPVAAAAPEPAAKPEPAPSSAPTEAATAAAEVEPEKPKGLDGPIGTADDLKRISGVGPVLEGKLNGLGFYHFWQIAKWTRAEVDWVDGYLSFKGRIDRDNWIDQATKLAVDSPSKPPA